MFVSATLTNHTYLPFEMTYPKLAGSDRSVLLVIFLQFLGNMLFVFIHSRLDRVKIIIGLSLPTTTHCQSQQANPF